MTGPQRDKKWRQTWQNAAPRAEFSRPTDAVFEKAEAAMMDPGRDSLDKRCAALAGVPQQVSTELCLPMWIPARELTVTFSDTEIMTSLGSTVQSPLWSKSLEHLRDFKTIRNAGVSFICTDREVCTKLGGESVTICGRKFKVQTYSKYSHWYYVDLQRLPDDVSDGLIYDWFARQGTPPVYITPAHVVGGLRSRSRRVYFNQKTPPASVMIDKRTPLRQIRFTDHGYTVVHHRMRAFNQTIPPFIKELREKAKPARQPKPTTTGASADDEDSTPPAFDNESESSYHPSSDADCESHSGDQSDGESTGSGMIDIEPPVVARPDSVWPVGTPPKFPTGSSHGSDFMPVRILRAKRLVFGPVAEPAVEMQVLPPSQEEYPLVSSLNTYEWLSEGAGGPIPPDSNIILWDKTANPPRSIGSYVALTPLAETMLNGQAYKGKVEELSLTELYQAIESFLGEFVSTSNPDHVLACVQSQPSLHRVLLDTNTEGNFHQLRSKAFGHAVLRGLSTQAFTPELDTVTTRLASLYPDTSDFDYQSILSQLYPDQTHYWAQVKLAEFDLAMFILAPSIYLDPLKLGAVIRKAPKALSHPLWLLWDDQTVAAVIMSPLMGRILAGPLPTELRATIDYLREQTTSKAATVPTHL